MKFTGTQDGATASRRLRIRQGRLAMTGKADPGGALDEREPDLLQLSERDYTGAAPEPESADGGELPPIPL